jgi:hypothetical protein
MTLTELAQQADAYKQQYEAGQLSADEFKELVDDIQIQQSVAQLVEDQEQNETNYAILQTVIATASLLG